MKDKKPVISSPIKYDKAIYKETQQVEAACQLALDIKEYKTQIKHNKASTAMKYISNAIDSVFNEMDEKLKKVAANSEEKKLLIGEFDKICKNLQDTIQYKIGKGSVLGEWFTQERNTKHQYQKMMHDLELSSSAEIHKKSGIEQIIPRRLSKLYNSITQNYRERISSTKSTATSDTESISSDEESIDRSSHMKK